jgi:hypothetical protein
VRHTLDFEASSCWDINVCNSSIFSRSDASVAAILAVSAARADSMDVTRDWRSWNRLSSEFGRRLDGLDVTRFTGTRIAPPVVEYVEDLGGADVARDRERGVFDVDNVGARGFVSAGGAKLIGYALRDVLGAVLDGLRVLEDIAGSL